MLSATSTFLKQHVFFHCETFAVQNVINTLAVVPGAYVADFYWMVVGAQISSFLTCGVVGSQAIDDREALSSCCIGTPSCPHTAQLVRTWQGNTYSVKLKKENGKVLGLTLDLSDPSAALVMTVGPGLAMAWNKLADHEHQIRPLDRIIEVNGFHSNSRQIIQSIKEDAILRFVIARPSMVRASFDRDGKSLGLGVTFVPNGSTLLILKTASDPLEYLNEDGKSAQLSITCRTDRIVEVNGIKGSARELFNTLTTAEKLDMELACYDTSCGILEG